MIAVLVIALFTGAAGRKKDLAGDVVYDRGARAVFYVRALNENGALKMTGTAFFTDFDGTALTAAHVVDGAASVEAVVQLGGREVAADVLYVDTVTDIAVLKLPERESGYPYLVPSDEAPRSGETLYAIGFPQKSTKLVSDGIVSAPVAQINGLSRLLMSADLASGMSGGPVLCQHGELIGLSTATVRTMNGVSTAATAEQMLRALEQAEKGREQK